MAKSEQTLDVFRTRVELLKKEIIRSIKLETKLLRDCNKAKTDNDKAALLDKIKNVRHHIYSYRTALNDLTYAFLQKHRDNDGLRIVSRFGYKTVEGYLEDKRTGIMPRLDEIMDLILNYFQYIDSYYEFGYGPQNSIKRNTAIIERLKRGASVYTSTQRQSLDVFRTYDEVRKMRGAVDSGAKHR